MKKILLLSLSLVLVFSTVFAARLKKVTETVDIQDAKKIYLKGELGAGEFRIFSENQDEAFIAEISHSRNIEYWVEAKYRSEKCTIEVGSEQDNNNSIDTEDNIWNIILSKKYPIEIDLDIGACKGEFDLGGLQIEELTLDIGAAEAEFFFSEKNKIRLKEIDIDAGACAITMHDIGNANFESFKLEGGAGSFDLDFLGTYEGTSYIDIEIGLGSVDIVLPKNIPVQIHTDGSNWLSSIDLHSNRLDEVDNDIFESDDFEDAKDRIILNISVGLGSVDVRFRK